jgi:hypothetical protein
MCGHILRSAKVECAHASRINFGDIIVDGIDQPIRYPWPPSNKTFVPALGTVHLDLRLAICGLSSSNRGRVAFINAQFSPGGRRTTLGGAAKYVLRPFQFASRRTLPSTQIGFFILTESNFVKPKNKREQNARCQRYHEPEQHGLNRSHRRPTFTLRNLTFTLSVHRGANVAQNGCPHQSTTFLARERFTQQWA